MPTWITVVLEFDEPCAHAFSAGDTAFGGRVVAVQFDDALAEIERMEDRALGILKGNQTAGLNTEDYQP